MLAGHSVVARKFMVSLRVGLAIVVAMLSLGAPVARAQTNPLTYWTPGWPLGFGGGVAVDQNAETYGNFPSFDASRGGGFSYTRYNFSNGWYVGNEGGGLGLGGINSAFSGMPSVYSEGVQFGYNFQKSYGLPVSVYAGFDNLKYNPGIGSSLGAFDSTSTTLPGYSAHAGLEIRPTSNVSLSFGMGYTQQGSGRVDSDINSALLPGASSSAFTGGRR
jgi:opacity protein-like surface antigen